MPEARRLDTLFRSTAVSGRRVHAGWNQLGTSGVLALDAVTREDTEGGPLFEEAVAGALSVVLAVESLIQREPDLVARLAG